MKTETADLERDRPSDVRAIAKVVAGMAGKTYRCANPWCTEVATRLVNLLPYCQVHADDEHINRRLARQREQLATMRRR